MKLTMAQTETHKAIESFTGMDIDSETILKFVNRPENALLLQHDAHTALDNLSSWGIEASVDDSGDVSFILPHCTTISCVTVGTASLHRQMHQL
jgi:hypothetical protein